LTRGFESKHKNTYQTGVKKGRVYIYHTKRNHLKANINRSTWKERGQMNRMLWEQNCKNVRTLQEKTKMAVGNI
jgi:hypothetical protein